MSRSYVGAQAPWLRCRDRRAHHRSVFACILLFSLAAESMARASADPMEPIAPLTMEKAARLTTVDQPLLTGRQAKIQAEDQQAIAASQLPDPQLSGGLKELPIDTSEAFSTRRDNFTEFTIGLSQEFPRAEKRRLQGARKQLDADADRAALDNEERMMNWQGVNAASCRRAELPSPSHIPDERSNPINRLLIFLYRPLLDLVFRHPKTTLTASVLLVVTALLPLSTDTPFRMQLTTRSRNELDKRKALECLSGCFLSVHEWARSLSPPSIPPLRV